MSAARRAQATAAKRVTEVMTPLIGTDSEAMRMLREQLPSPDEPSAPQKHRPVTVYNEEREAVARPSRPTPRSATEESDYDQRTVLKKGRR